MVNRSTAAPRHPLDKIEANREALGDLSRAHGRGTTAMRDASGNVLTMNADAPYPLITPQGIDSALAFDTDGTVRITSTDTLQNRDLGVRSIQSTGGATFAQGIRTEKSLSTGSGVTAGDTSTFNGGMYLNGVLSCNSQVQAETFIGQAISRQLNLISTAFYADRAQVGLAEAPINGRITGREMTLEGNAYMKGNVYVDGNFIDNTPSERELKNHVRDVDDGLDVVNSLCPAEFTWRDPELRDDRTHVGIYVNELADVAPHAIVQPLDPSVLPTEDPEGAVARRQNGRSYEDRALIAYLVSAVQTLSRRVDALERREEQRPSSP